MRHLLKRIHTELKTHLLNPGSSSSTEVVTILLQYLQCFQRHCVLPHVVQEFFTHTFNLMDATIFNDTMLRKELCTFSSAFTLKIYLEEMLQTLSDQGYS